MESVHTDNSIYAQGWEAYLFGAENPYDQGTQQWHDFEAGWQDACDQERGF